MLLLPPFPGIYIPYLSYEHFSLPYQESVWRVRSRFILKNSVQWNGIEKSQHKMQYKHDWRQHKVRKISAFQVTD
jgi:hypothetical protein